MKLLNMYPEKQKAENFEKSQQKQNIENSNLEKSQIQQVQIHLGSLFNLGTLIVLSVLIIGFIGLVMLLVQTQLGLKLQSLLSSSNSEWSNNNQTLNQDRSSNPSKSDKNTLISSKELPSSYESNQSSISNDPPKFVTDLIKDKKIGFTLLYPGRLIKITDIRISVFLGRNDYLDYYPVGYEEEKRFILPKTTLRLPTREVNLSPQKERLFEAQDQEDINLSIIDEKKYIKLYGDTSFLSEFGTSNFINVIDFSFRFKLIYLDKGEKKDIFSDSIFYFYSTKNGYSIEEINIEEILRMRLVREGLNPECLQNVNLQDSERLFLLRHLRESYSGDAKLLLSYGIGNNIFDFLLDAYTNTLKKCKNKKYSSMFIDEKLISRFANSEDEFSRILQLIQNLNDTDDFDAKLNLIEVLIEKNDRRAIPYAQSFIKNNADIEDTGITYLKEKLKEYGLILDQEK